MWKEPQQRRHMESWEQHAKEIKIKKKDKCAFTLTKVNVAKGTTPYFSPEPVLVPHSQLHGCELLLSPTDKKQMRDYKLQIIRKQRTHYTMLANLGCASFPSPLTLKHYRMSYCTTQLNITEDYILDLVE